MTVSTSWDEAEADGEGRRPRGLQYRGQEFTGDIVWHRGEFLSRHTYFLCIGKHQPLQLTRSCPIWASWPWSMSSWPQPACRSWTWWILLDAWHITCTMQKVSWVVDVEEDREEKQSVASWDILYINAIHGINMKQNIQWQRHISRYAKDIMCHVMVQQCRRTSSLGRFEPPHHCAATQIHQYANRYKNKEHRYG